MLIVKVRRKVVHLLYRSKTRLKLGKCFLSAIVAWFFNHFILITTTEAERKYQASFSM